MGVCYIWIPVLTIFHYGNTYLLRWLSRKLSRPRRYVSYHLLITNVTSNIMAGNFLTNFCSISTQISCNDVNRFWKIWIVKAAAKSRSKKLEKKMDSSTGTIASIIIDFIVVVQVERGWSSRLILIMIILILTKILIRLIDSSIQSGLGFRHQHCLSICRVSVKKDKFHKIIENFIKKSSHRAQHYKWTASAIFFMYLPGYLSSKDQTRQDHLLRPDQPDHWFWL